MTARDRRRPFWSKWVWKDWLAKTQDMSPEARGGYMDLLAYAATNSPDCCSVPDDDQLLAYAARMRPERWRACRSVILASRWELRPDGRWEHPRLAEDACSWAKYVEYQRSRVNRRSTDGTTDGATPVHHARGGKKLEVRIETEEESTPSAQSPPQPPARTPRPRPPATARPALNGFASLPTNTNGDWNPTPLELEAYAAAYPAVELQATFNEMRAWLIANPTRRKTLTGMPRFVNAWLAREQNRP